MDTSTTRPPRRQRKPLLPVQIKAQLVGGASRQDVIDGSAVLSITDLATGDEAPYWLEALYVDGRCTGFRVRKFGGEEVYDLPRDLSSCDCPDRTYKPERPGGCKHMVALKQALPTVAK